MALSPKMPAFGERPRRDGVWPDKDRAEPRRARRVVRHALIAGTTRAPPCTSHGCPCVHGFQTRSSGEQLMAVSTVYSPRLGQTRGSW